MEPHPVPRQITTFEFKLIGFMTLKEFAYMIVFAALATATYFLIPGELFKYIGAALVFGVGIFLAFYKYNERSVDVWIRNLLLKLFSSSQYYYHKRNDPPSFLENIIYDKSIAVLHTDAQKKLTSYLGKVGNPPVSKEEAKTNVGQTVPENAPEIPPREMSQPIHAPIEAPDSVVPVAPDLPTGEAGVPQTTQTLEHPALSGIVKNGKDLPLPNILVYVKNKDGQIARILKTNIHGMFSTTKPLGDEPVVLEPKDSANRFFFDTLNINPSVAQPLVIRSREAL